MSGHDSEDASFGISRLIMQAPVAAGTFVVAPSAADTGGNAAIAAALAAGSMFNTADISGTDVREGEGLLCFLTDDWALGGMLVLCCCTHPDTGSVSLGCPKAAQCCFCSYCLRKSSIFFAQMHTSRSLQSYKACLVSQKYHHKRSQP